MVSKKEMRRVRKKKRLRRLKRKKKKAEMEKLEGPKPKMDGTIPDPEKQYSGLMRPWKISPEMRKIVGIPTGSRADIMKLLWRYVRLHHLQDPRDKRYFFPDKKMEPIFGTMRMRMHATMKFVGPHLRPLNKEEEDKLMGVKELKEVPEGEEGGQQEAAAALPQNDGGPAANAEVLPNEDDPENPTFSKIINH